MFGVSSRTMKIALLSVLFTIVASVTTHAYEDIYNPISVGLRWEYAVVLTTPAGKVLHGTMTREITGTAVIAGKTYFVSATRFDGLPDMQPFSTYRRKGSRGIYAINSFDPQKKEYIEAAFPLTVDQKWRSAGDDMMTFTVAAEEDVTVNGRRYPGCLKIVSSADRFSPVGTYYLAPYVGNVRDTAKQGGATYEFTLNSFNGTK